jgi:tetratricopeptide (TPR) repeat protein
MSRFTKVLNPRLLSRPAIHQPRLVTTKPKSLANFSTSSYRGASRNGPRPPLHIPPLPVALIGLGLTCLGIGLYGHLTSDIQKYPKDIRQALRKALYYQQDKDIDLSLKYFNEALTLALESDEMERNGAPLTGIMIQLGTLQERLGRLPEARQTLLLAMRHLLGLENDRCSKPPYTDDGVFDVDLSKLSTTDQKKAVGIAQKLGDITSSMKRDDEAEKWYVWSVEHLLAASSRPRSEYGDDGGQVVFDEEHMPVWLTHTDIGAAMEALGVFYASRKKPQ